MADNNRAAARLKEQFPSSILDITEFRGETAVTVLSRDILEILLFLKKSLRYEMLTDLTAIDYMGKKEERFMVVYQLTSISCKERVRIKVPVAEDDCTIRSATAIWQTANWLEREVYDLFGINFENHPDLQRILMTPDWEGHPLRKDYPLQGPDREPYKGRLS